MLSDSTLLPQNPLVMPVSTSSNGGTATNGGVKTENVETKKATPEGANNFPPPKTDKPRPHVCDVQTCQRAFARLEHLKRHERSHTKEKPFECPECGRSFARRDLLLRHQQKLHMTTTPSSRPRNRRESAASTSGAAGRVRKSSVANGAGSMRPRANTISHVDGTAALHPHMMAQSNVVNARQGAGQGHSRHASLIGLPQQTDYQFGGMSAALGQRGIAHGLPKLETNGFNNVDFSGLRTAPPMGGFPSEFDFEGQLFSSSTINPNALHYSGDSPMSMGLESPFPHHYAFQQDMGAGNNFEESFDWMPNGFDAQMNFNNHENAIDGSSPSAISTASHSGMSEVMLDGSNNPAMSASMWQQQQQPMMAPPLMTPNFNLDMSGGMDMSGASFPDLLNGGPMSPHTLPSKNSNDQYFSTPPPSMSSMSPMSMMPGLNANGIQQTMNFGRRPHPLSTVAYHIPHYPPSPIPHGKHLTIPSTADLQRYIGAYIRYFHPHLPFLHIPTLSFDVPTNQGRSQTGMVGGRGCLILSMAAIGALYEMEHAQSKELFESGKKMIQLYIEERRKADVRKADMRKAGVPDHSSPNSESTAHTPVWLVQAMLLNVVYGHNCGDKISGDIASTHSAALVSLARAAELLRPGQDGKSSDTNMTDGETDSWKQEDEQLEWHNWLMAEERKRTLYSIFILSSLLVAAYNHAPVLTNSEILLDLPCEEEFWSSESAAAFQARGGVRMATHNQVTFHDALGELLRTSERQLSQQQFYTNGMNNLPQSDLKPSTFGCLVLINALHNYIWETRQRHHSKIWTNEETEKMHRHIEPALKAWQAAWASNPHHSLERPNPFGLGPLSADSIPLLDLAYVRLFVNLSRSKEKFWQRDYDGMAEELSGGNEIIQHAEHSPQSNVDSSSDPSETSGSSRGFDSPPTSSGTPDYPNLSASMLSTAPGGSAATTMTPSSTKRERHLRKAAFYAADSLCMSDKLGVTFADFTSRELPLQSAMCAFDCAQVLAEWVATVQERVGSLMGVLGRDECDYTVVPGIMMLEDEDVKLLGKVHEVLASAEAKIRGLENNAGINGNININAMNNINGLGTPGINGTTDSMANVGHIGTGGFIAGTEWGYGSRILKVTAYMLDKAAVWPVTHLMARALEIQANHMRARAENSVLNRREL